MCCSLLVLERLDGVALTDYNAIRSVTTKVSMQLVWLCVCVCVCTRSWCVPTCAYVDACTRSCALERAALKPLSWLAMRQCVCVCVCACTQDPEAVLVSALNTWFASVMGAETFHADVHAGTHTHDTHTHTDTQKFLCRSVIYQATNTRIRYPARACKARKARARVCVCVCVFR